MFKSPRNKHMVRESCDYAWRHTAKSGALSKADEVAEQALGRPRFLGIQSTHLLRVNVTKNQRNRGHSSKFNFAHTLSIGRPKSHTYDKDVRLLKFSLVWEKSTWNGFRYFLEQNLQNCHNSWRCRVSSSQVLNYFHTNPIFLMLLQLIDSKRNS